MWSFCRSSHKKRISCSAAVFPVQNPDVSEHSNLSSDSDEEFIVSESEEKVYTSETSDDTSDDSSDEQKQQQQPWQIPLSQQCQAKPHNPL